MTCWKCQNIGHDASGFCRRCGADVNHPTRPATREELLIINRYKHNPPTYASTINTRVPESLDD